MRIRNQLLFVMAGALLLVTIGFAALVYRIQKKESEERVDAELRAVAIMAREVLPPGYHDRIQSKGSVSRKEYSAIVDQFNRICAKQDLDYIWSLMLIDGKIVFTSATSPSKNVLVEDHADFFEIHSNPELYTNAFATMQPQLQVNDDKWGRIRAALIPFRDSQGRPYLICASRSMRKVEQEVQTTVISSVALGAGILMIGVLSCLALARSLSHPIEAVTIAATDIAKGNLGRAVQVQGAKEIELLGDSINRMGCAIGERLRELSESRENLRITLDSIGEAVITTDSQGRVTGINPVAEGLTGYTAERSIGKAVEQVFRIVHPNTCHPIESPVGVALREGETVRLPHHTLLLAHGGGQRQIEVTAAPIRNGYHVTVGAVMVFRDVSEDYRKDLELRSSEEKYRKLFNSFHDAVLVQNVSDEKNVWSSTFAEVNDTACLRLNYLPSELVKLGLEDITEPAARPALAAVAAELFTHKQVLYESSHQTRDGRLIPVEINAHLFTLSGRPTILLVARDITERKLAEAARQRLEREVIEVSEREQRRLGRDLHDDLGQQLFGVRLILEALEQKIESGQEGVRALVQKTGNLLQHAIITTRSLAKGFYPVDLARNGLIASLSDLATRTTDVYGVRCLVRYTRSFRYEEASSIHLYRIVQEALNNALKHGNPSFILIKCVTIKGVPTIQVINDGIPFSAPRAAMRERGMGLEIFRYRAEIIGANLDVRSGAKGGCIVTCSLRDRT